MKLVMVTQDFPPVPGGIQTYAAELALRFHHSMDDFAVIAPNVEGSESWDQSVPYRVIRVGKSSDHVPVTAISALVKLGRQGFSAAFHTQWQTVTATKSAQRFGGPSDIYLAAHGRELLLRPLDSIPFAQPFFDRLRRWCIGQATKLFPVSRYTASLLRDLGATEDKILRVPNGTDPKRFKPLDVQELRRAHQLEGKKVILSVGRLAPRKGFDTVIEAMPRIVEAMPEALYVMVGAGPDRERLEKLAHEHGVEDYILMVGKVAWDELPLWHNVADVFVTPSRNAPPSVEGFGIVFLEANACGKPVIGARTGGIPDAIVDGQTGRLVEADAPDELAHTILEILGDPSLAQSLGEQGRRRVLESGTWDHVHDTLYRALIES